MSIFENPVGKMFGPYKVVEKLGRGGMAAVFQALHEPTQGLVALKVFIPPDGDTTEFFKRAKREVVALQMCSHPNILKVHGFEFEGEGGYVAVEYIQGKNLQEVSDERGKQDLDLLVKIARDVGGALAYIHARGLFHRDLKPANIMLEEGTGRCVLLDFGIVKATNLTQISGFQKEVMGTLTYMAPEQFLSRDVDGRTDLYQLGLVLYRLATQSDPPPVMDLVERADRGLAGPALPIRGINPDLPESFEMVIANLTHPAMEGRYSTAHELLKDLTKVQAGEPVAAKPVAPMKKGPSSTSARTTGPNPRTTGGVRAQSGPQTRPNMRQPTGNALRPTGSAASPVARDRVTGANPALSKDAATPAGGTPKGLAKPSAKTTLPATTDSGKGKLIAAAAAIVVALCVLLWRFLK